MRNPDALWLAGRPRSENDVKVIVSLDVIFFAN